jgi:hypothetical protein
LRRVVATRAKACAAADFVTHFEFTACLFADFDDNASGVNAEADREAIRNEDAILADKGISALMSVGMIGRRRSTESEFVGVIRPRDRYGGCGTDK